MAFMALQAPSKTATDAALLAHANHRAIPGTESRGHGCFARRKRVCLKSPGFI
jgi:hypothetical protein